MKEEEYSVIIAVIVNTVFHLQEDQTSFLKNSFMNILKGNKLSNNFHFTTKKVADATFFGRRSDRLGTLVFKDVLSGKIVAGKHIERENADDYKQLIDELIEKVGYKVLLLMAKEALLRHLETFQCKCATFIRLQL